MRRVVTLIGLVVLSFGGCVDLEAGRFAGTAFRPVRPSDTTGRIIVYGPPGSPKRRPTCADASEWEVLTWPELEPVATTATEPREDSTGCPMELVPATPFSARWYAVHWSGHDLAPWAAEYDHARQLSDDTWVWPFHGVVHARITWLERNDLEGHALVQATLSEAVDPAPGVSWDSLMTVTQARASCAYPGELVHWGSATVGFSETLVVDCVGLDWAMPVHVHVEGAVTRGGDRLPVPVVDLDHTFDASPEERSLHIADPDDEPVPPCTSPRCE